MMKSALLLAAAAPAVFAQKASDGPVIPEGCTSYNDGCNTCVVQRGQLAGCTMMMCFRQGTPFCAAYDDGRTCTGPDACTAGAASGGGAPEGARCSTSRTRGNPRGVPCAAGLTCRITDRGMIAADRPNSGVCTSSDVVVDHARPGPIAIEPMPVMHPTDPLVEPAPAQYCPASRPQMCRMLCPAPTCPDSQCAMRTGTCCDYTCQSTSDAATGPNGHDEVATSSGLCSTALAASRPMPGAFTPQCDENGDYQPVQCHGSIGSCWCVSTDGTEIPGTRMNSRSGQVLDVSTCAQISHPDIMVDPAFGGQDTSVAQFGDRCAQGFCENPMDCPQCADGLTCNVPAGMMCAGTCYGTCGKGH